MLWWDLRKLRSAYDSERIAAIDKLAKSGDPRALNAIVATLKDRSSNVQLHVVDVLGKIGAVSPLLLAMKENNKVVRVRAAEMLGNIRDKITIEPLIMVLKNDPVSDVRAAAARALGFIGDVHAVKALLVALKDIGIKESKTKVTSSEIQKWNSVNKDAAMALNKIISERSDSEEFCSIVPSLAAMVREKEPFLRYASIEVLKSIDQPTAIKILLQASIKEDYAATAVKNLKSKKAVEPLIQALKDEDKAVRRIAVEVLGKIGDKEAVEPLLHALKDEDDVVQVKAIRVLAEMVDQKTVVPFFQALKHLHSIHRHLADKVLEKIVNRKAVELLLHALKDEDNFVRKMAAEGLGKSGDQKAVEPLLQALKDEDKAVRKMAIEGLGKLGDQKAVEPLLHALKDKDDVVRSLAAEALGNIGDPKAVDSLIQSREYLVGWKPWAMALGKLGVKKAAEAVIDRIIPLCPEEKLNKEEVAAFRNLFGHYTDLILNAGRYSYSRKTVGREDPHTSDYYDIDLYPVRALCGINSPISSNILIKLSQMVDIEVTIRTETYMGERSTEHRLNYEPIRTLAQNELKKRGHPSYNPSAYLDDDAWNIMLPPKRK